MNASVASNGSTAPVPGQSGASDATLAPLLSTDSNSANPNPTAITEAETTARDGKAGTTTSDGTLSTEGMNLFQRFLTIWVLLAMVVGVLLGHYIPAIPEALEKVTIAQVSIPIAVLLWGIIMPMMLQIDFLAVKNALKQPKAILLTTVVNYAIQPFTMYGLAVLFFKVIFANYLGVAKANEYLVGSLLLGGAPCTAMVFVWSTLMRGDPAYTLTQVAVNDLILLLAYSPTVKLLAGAEDIPLPWDTLFLSVGFFVLIPLVLGVMIRTWFTRTKESAKWLDTVLIPKLNDLATVFLVLMVVMLFITQAGAINSKLVDILIITVPLIIQTLLIWGITYGLALVLRLPYSIAGPATLIACSNFFEMAVAVAISLYGTASGVALATVVGVLIEVPVMLLLVEINNRTKGSFDRRAGVQ